MQIELKNFRHAEFASDETHCYEATIWIDGKRSFLAHNDGQGGSDHYYPLINSTEARTEFNAVMERVEAHCNSLPKYGSEFGGEDDMPMNLEILIGNLINRTLSRKKLKRVLKNKIVTLERDEVWEYGYSRSALHWSDAMQKTIVIDEIKKKNPNVTILNDLPFDDALEIFSNR
jgi:hypothetical protein